MNKKKNPNINRYKVLYKIDTFLAYISLLVSIALVILFNVPLFKMNLRIENLSILILTVGLFIYFRINAVYYRSLLYIIENNSSHRPKEKKRRSEY